MGRKVLIIDILTPDNMIALMVSERAVCDRINKYVSDIMKIKEAEERE